jgi:hypothetical protein
VTKFLRSRVYFTVHGTAIFRFAVLARKVHLAAISGAPWVCVVTPITPAAIGSLPAHLGLQFFG